MGLFSKKKEETKSSCCGGSCTPKTMEKAEVVNDKLATNRTTAYVRQSSAPYQELGFPLCDFFFFLQWEIVLRTSGIPTS